MGVEHVPQHDCHGLQTCKYHRINRETPGSGSCMPPSARAVSPWAFQHHLDEHKSHGRQEHSPLSQPEKAPLARGCPSSHHRGDSKVPEGAQGSHPRWSTEALTSSDTRSGGEEMTQMHSLTHTPSPAMEGTCQAIQPRARVTLQLSMESHTGLGWKGPHRAPSPTPATARDTSHNPR